MSVIAIRQATLVDAAPLARLVSGLGYPTSPNQMQRRLEAILRNADYETLVAVRQSEIVGFVGTRIGCLYEQDDRYGQIMALAVATDQHRRGVGRLLLQAAETRLVERGARVLVVTSGIPRTDAHAFYEACGYTFTGRRYMKAFTSV